jgi:phenylalanyl-tRNA synthetase beta chain
MKISYNWLTEYLKSSVDQNSISLLLTDIGLEVEGIEYYESVKGGMDKFITGEVISCQRHPNADKLSITTVNVGQPELLNIVCGAPNVSAGQKVIVALEGAVVYKGNESFKISKSKIRGEVSQGMICAEDELGIGESHDGILVLPDNTQVGIPASEYFNITRDTVFEIGITPNHADALSHIGAARDLHAAIRARGMGDANIQFPDISDFVVDNNDYPIEIEVRNPEDCPRYSGVTVKGVKVGPSPDWLQNRLKAVGLRPINNIVDISNYILMEYGQPLHTFDADKIKGRKIVVRRAYEGSKFVTLDNVERKLLDTDLMICDVEDPMCIAGVFGGAESGVGANTTNIFIESAYFNPVTIRKTSKHHTLKTDASFRYERGTDPNITVVALKRAAMLIKSLAGGEISSDLVDVYPNQVKNTELDLTFSEIDKLAGNKIPNKTVVDILELLSIKVNKVADDNLSVSIPPFRVDVKNLADIVEEVLRIYSYNKIHSDHNLRSSISYKERPDQELLYNKVADYLVSNNFNEILTNSLSSELYYNDSKYFNAAESVQILNPLSKELNVMRQTLLFGGLESIAHNINRKQNNLKFFEFGNVHKLNTNAKTNEVTDKYHQRKQLILFVTGNEHSEHWQYKDKKTDFYFIQGYVLNILRMLGIDTESLVAAESENIFSKGVAFSYNNRHLYSVGSLDYDLIGKTGVNQEVLSAIIEWSYLVELVRNHQVTYQEVPKFPEVRRDLALVLERNVEYKAIEKVAKRVNKHLLKSMNLFDVYEGDKIEQGKKSYAVSFILQDENKTLTDKEIDNFMNKLSKSLEEELGARIRK